MNLVNRAMGGGIIGGVIGWVSLQLTVGMVLARNFDLARSDQFSILWWFACVVGGGFTGVAWNKNWLADQTRFVAWGAVASLTALMITTRLPLMIMDNPQYWAIAVPGTRWRFQLEDIGLVSAPAALIAGGILGWYVHRLIASRREVASGNSSTDGTACETASECEPVS